MLKTIGYIPATPEQIRSIERKEFDAVLVEKIGGNWFILSEVWVRGVNPTPKEARDENGNILWVQTNCGVSKIEPSDNL